MIPLKLRKKKKQKPLGEDWEFDDSDHPVHEKYTREERVKE